MRFPISWHSDQLKIHNIIGLTQAIKVENKTIAIKNALKFIQLNKIKYKYCKFKRKLAKLDKYNI